MPVHRSSLVLRAGLALVLSLSATGALAEVHAHADAPSPVRAAPSSPYAGLQVRDIKALSAEQTEDLLAGRGMTLALPAELNGLPGPAHVLELADPLGLDAGQRDRTRRLAEQMKTEARALGAQVVQAERVLDRLFKEGRATAAALSKATAEAAQVSGRLREAHLKYHLLMEDVLTPEQVARYRQLRGYGDAPAAN